MFQFFYSALTDQMIALLDFFLPIFSALPDILNCLDGVKYAMIENGYCNDETNNAEGSYDGGDCCGTNVNTDFCSDCKCYKVDCAAGIPHPIVGDGICNDETNTPE